MSSLCSSMYSRNDLIRAAAFSRPSGTVRLQGVVLRALIDSLLEGLLHIEDGVPKLGVPGKRLRASAIKLTAASDWCRIVRGAACGLDCRDLVIGVESDHNAVGDVSRPTPPARSRVVGLFAGSRVSRRARRPAIVDARSGSPLPKATIFMRSFRLAEGLRSRGSMVCEGVSITPTASTTMKRSLRLASSVTAWNSVSSMTRTPRPIICSK